MSTFRTYDAIGNREDLTDAIYTISPTETPFISMAAKRSASGVYHEWQTDSLAAASTSNAATEGASFTAVAVTPTTRVGNYCQISTKVISISGTQDAVKKAGRSSETAYQVAKKGLELRRDMESILTGNQAISAGSTTTAIRNLRSLEAWYSTNISRGIGGSSGSTTQAATDATTANHRVFTEALLKTVIKSAWDNGGAPDTLMVGSFNRQVVSGFAGNATRVVNAEEKALVASISVYASDFGDIKIVPNRFSRARTAHLLQSDMVGVAYLRPIKVVDIATTGDDTKKALVTEYTLEMDNEAAHGVIADLTVA